MFKEEFKKLLETRENIWQKTRDEDSDSLEKVWMDEKTLIVKNYDEAIEYILTEASWDEMTYMSEVFDELYELGVNMKFIDAVHTFIEQNRANGSLEDIQRMENEIERYKLFVE